MPICPTCNGKGEQYVPCPKCGGSRPACLTCKGNGIVKVTCWDCGGRGTV